MNPHSIIIVSLHTPKEKLWGELLSINPAGITIRGIDLNIGQGDTVHADRHQCFPLTAADLVA